MCVIEFQGRMIETDAEGYLLHPSDYSDELRDYIASTMGLELTNEHIKVIELVRSYYDEYATTPPMRGLILQLKQHGMTEIANSRALARLFPDGAAKSAAKLAGLPKPAKCI